MKNVNFVENLLNKQRKLQSFNYFFSILNTQNGILNFFNLKGINLEMCLYNVGNIIFHISQIKHKFILERTIFVTYVNSSSVYLCLCDMFVICWCGALTYFIIVSNLYQVLTYFHPLLSFLLILFCRKKKLINLFCPYSY